MSECISDLVVSDLVVANDNTGLPITLNSPPQMVWPRYRIQCTCSTAVINVYTCIYTNTTSNKLRVYTYIHVHIPRALRAKITGREIRTPNKE